MSSLRVRMLPCRVDLAEDGCKGHPAALHRLLAVAAAAGGAIRLDRAICRLGPHCSLCAGASLLASAQLLAGKRVVHPLQLDVLARRAVPMPSPPIHPHVPRFISQALWSVYHDHCCLLAATLVGRRSLSAASTSCVASLRMLNRLFPS